jgi:hypothetical protein
MSAKLVISLLIYLASATSLLAAVYQEPDAFLAEVFSGEVPDPKVIWLTGDRKKISSDILGHRYSSLRIRYWQQGNRTAWILEEIGKDLPITIGFVIEDGRMQQTRVLIFRESRGWEIRHPFFTDQFDQAQLNAEQQLDRTIDGISGATLSVRAMKKLATLSLYLDQQARLQDVSSPP